MNSYIIGTSPRGERSLTRIDGAGKMVGIPTDLDNRDFRLFIYEWGQGAPTTNPNGAPRPFTLARLHQFRPDLQPILDWPLGT